MNSILDAIGAFGTALDRFTGGRAVRGLLAGKPSELASIIPFSDTMGLTSAADVTSGRDLLNQYGLTDPNSQGWGPFLGGIAVEMASSPLSYIGGAGAAKAAPEVLTGAASLAERATPAVGKFLAEETGALAPRLVAQRTAELANKLGLGSVKLGKPLKTALESEAARAIEREAAGLPINLEAPGSLWKIESGPRYVESRKPAQILSEMADEMSQKLVGNIAGQKIIDVPPEHVGLARSFLNLPKLPRSSNQANALLDSLANQWGASVQSVGDYTGPGYRRLNSFLNSVAMQGPAAGVPDRIAAELETMRNAAKGREFWSPDLIASRMDEEPDFVRRLLGGRIMGLMDQAKTPQPLTVYRGLDPFGTTSVGLDLGTAIDSPQAVGRQIFEPRFMSTSIDPQIAMSFAAERGPGTLFNIDVPGGRPGAFINSAEKEVLMPPGQRIQIEKILRPRGGESGPSIIQARLLQAILSAMGVGAGYSATKNLYPLTAPSPAA